MWSVSLKFLFFTYSLYCWISLFIGLYKMDLWLRNSFLFLKQFFFWFLVFLLFLTEIILPNNWILLIPLDKGNWAVLYTAFLICPSFILWIWILLLREKIIVLIYYFLFNAINLFPLSVFRHIGAIPLFFLTSNRLKLHVCLLKSRVYLLKVISAPRLNFIKTYRNTYPSKSSCSTNSMPKSLV